MHLEPAVLAISLNGHFCVQHHCRFSYKTLCHLSVVLSADYVVTLKRDIPHSKLL